MSAYLCFLFLPFLFKFFLCHDSPNYRFYLTFDNNEYEITMANNSLGNEFKEKLINTTEIQATFTQSSNVLFILLRDAFPKLNNYVNPQTIITFASNSILYCQRYFILTKVPYSPLDCSLVALFEQPIYPDDQNIFITFKAKEIKTEDNKDINEDNFYEEVLNLITITSILLLIFLYYLLLLYV